MNVRWFIQLSVAVVAGIVLAMPGISYAEDQTDIEGIEVDGDDFSLDAPSVDTGPDDNVGAPKGRKTDATGSMPLENFSTAGDDDKLNFGDNTELPAPKNVNETVGLDLNEPKKKNETPKVVQQEKSRKPEDPKNILKPIQTGSLSAPNTPSLATKPQTQPVQQVQAVTPPPAVNVPTSTASNPEQMQPQVSAPPPATIAEVIPENDFFGTPYVPGGRKIMAQGEAPEYYKVEGGDTLFDICDQLIDEPGYWPKLWALNPGIKNPHFIFPGMTLSFYPGDDATPPYLQVIAEQEILPIETGGLTEEELVAQPVGSIADVGPASDNTFITDRAFDSKQEADFINSDFETIGSTYEPNIAKIDIPAFFSEEEFPELATVLAGPMGQVNIPEGQSVVVEIEDQALSVGSLYTVVRPSGKIYNTEGDNVGYRYEFIGHIKVVDKTDDEDSVMAQVLKARHGVRPEDIVIAFRSTTRSYTTEASGIGSGEVNASVIGFEYANQTIGSQGQLIYIDKQFTPGSVLPIYQRMDQRMPVLLKHSVPNVESRIGVIKIIESSGTNSLGVVLKSELDIRLGDRLGRG